MSAYVVIDEELYEDVRELLRNIMSSRKASIGAMKNTYTPQLSVKNVDRLYQRLEVDTSQRTEGETMTEIKPCPFCGCRYVAREGIRDTLTVVYRKWYWVTCNLCFADGSAHTSRQNAIAAWNRVSAAVDLSENVVRNAYPNLYDKVMP